MEADLGSVKREHDWEQTFPGYALAWYCRRCGQQFKAWQTLAEQGPFCE